MSKVEEPVTEVDDDIIDADDPDTDEEELEELDLDDMLEIIDAVDERVQSLDRGFASFMRAITVILGDIEVVLSPITSAEGKAAAQIRIRAVVTSLQAAVAAQAPQPENPEPK